MRQPKFSHLRRFKDTEFLLLEGDFVKLLKKVGLSIGDSRFKKTFDNFKKVHELQGDNKSVIVPADLRLPFRYTIYDLTQLRDITASLKDFRDLKVLRQKLIKLMKGSEYPSTESKNNTHGRNTQFELKLYADLMDSEVKCTLMDPRPDIYVTGKDHNFAIECKRIYSDNDSIVRKRVGEARDQLKLHFEEHGQDIGIIALDITRRLTSGNKFLPDKNSGLVTAQLSRELDGFRKLFARFFSSRRIGDERIAGILLSASMYSYLSGERLAAHAQQIAVQNIHTSPYGQVNYAHALDEVFSKVSLNKTGRFKVIPD